MTCHMCVASHLVSQSGVEPLDLVVALLLIMILFLSLFKQPLIQDPFCYCHSTKGLF